MANGETAVVHREQWQLPDLQDIHHDGVHDAEHHENDDRPPADPEAGR